MSMLNELRGCTNAFESCHENYYNFFLILELGAMMRVTEMKPKSEEQTVSWTGNIVSYYLHVVDRTRVSIIQ